MRKPCVAGMFYEGSFDGLDRQLRACFLHRLGPGALPGKRRKQTAAVIVPHAGYDYSGPCAAWAYKELAESAVPDVYLVIGTAHRTAHSCFSMQDWETPLGGVKNHREATGRLAGSLGIAVDERGHAGEHSIEVQLPFLQLAAGRQLAFVPLLLSHDVDPLAFGRQLRGSVRGIGLRCVIVVSGDMTHYGAGFGYVPFASDVKQRLDELDRNAIELLLAKKAKEFLGYVRETGATICGAAPMACLTSYLGNEEGSLLSHYSSGELTQDYTSAVDYASIAYR